MSENAHLKLGENSYELPMVVGTEQEQAFDIKTLRSQSGVVTLDYGFVSTASCKSAITFLDGEKGILSYRGYPIEQLAEKSSFLEVCYLLIYGELPSRAEFEDFHGLIQDCSNLHEDIRGLIDAFPRDAHPMTSVSSVVCALSSVYAPKGDSERDEKKLFCRLISAISTIAAALYKRSVGEPTIYPSDKYSYTGDFLRMMFATPNRDFELDPAIEKALDLLFVLHADHEQNCSTSTVRLVGSSQANLFASIASGINALSGPLHGGANQAVIEMLEKIEQDGGDTEKYVALAKDKNSNFRLMGFGHRVYKNFDPRARIIKKAAADVLDRLGVEDPMLDIAKKLEKAALEDPYFVERKLYPNVDFYSGIIYRALGIPTDMFTVMFAIGRLPGWIAQWKEMNEDAAARIGRPRQIYIGHNARDYVPMESR